MELVFIGIALLGPGMGVWIILEWVGRKFFPSIPHPGAKQNGKPRRA